MSELFAEVDEMMRQERMVKLWKDHGGTLLTFLAALIIGTAASSAYKSWDKNAREDGTQAVMALIDSEDFPANITPENLEVRAGLRAVAMLSAAGEYVSQGETESALALFQQISADKSLPDDLRQLGDLSAARLQIQDKTADIPALLAPILDDKNSPWRYHARLEVASFYATHEDYTKARDYLAAILNTNGLPDTLYEKAESLDKIYAMKQGEQKAG